jgi:hypothetical protein
MEKKKYNSPVIELIILDNEISLALESSPPFGPGESTNLAPENFQNEPYKGNFV